MREQTPPASTMHTQCVSATSTYTPNDAWYVVNEGDNAWGIGHRPKEERKLIVQKAVREYIDKTLPKKYRNSMGFPDLPGFPGTKRLCDECHENPYDKIEIGVVEHYFCTECHTRWEADQEILKHVREQARQIDNVVPEELFEI